MGIYLNKNNIYPVQKPFITDYIDVFLNDETIIGFHDINSNYNLAELAELDINYNLQELDY